MRRLLKSTWFRVTIQTFLGLGVVDIITNLLAEEISSDSKGWVHAVTHSRLTLWLLGLLAVMVLIELYARSGTTRIELSKREVKFWGSGWANDMPLLPLRFQIFLSIRNKGDAPGYIKSVQIAKLDLGTDLIKTRHRTVSCHLAGGLTGGRRISWPYKVEAGQLDPNVRCDILMDPTVDTAAEFASRLEELKRYRIDLRYEYEGIDGTSKKKPLTACGDFKSFQAYVIEEWKRRGFHELVYAAKGI